MVIQRVIDKSGERQGFVNQSMGQLLLIVCHSHLAKIELLILDDWGLFPISITASRELLDILDNRIGLGSTIISSQLPLESWHGSIQDSTVADAVLDRIVHDSIRLDLEGESMRKIRATKNFESD